MPEILNYQPGMQVTLYLDIVGIDGYRMDGYTMPQVNRILFPGFTLASGYPAPFVRLDTGLYYYQFTLPQGAASVGSYLVDCSYGNPDTHLENFKTYQVIVTAPSGNYSVTTF